MKKGFTLAEVLITLGIVGVVAALVMPSIIANYKKKAWVAQLQKSVNTWNNGFRQMITDDGVYYLNDTQFAQSLLNKGKTEYNRVTAPSAPEATDILKKYFKITKIKDYTSAPLPYKYYNGQTNNTSSETNLRAIYLADGTIFYVWITNLNGVPGANSSNGYLYIDVNGDKKPNMFGRDVFRFDIDSKGRALPTGGLWQVEVWGRASSYYWRNNPTNYCGTPGLPVLPADTNGQGCAARIIENGWVMDY